MLLSGKNIAVVGAAGAIGSEVSRTMASHGAQVLMLGRTKPSLEIVASQIRQTGGKASVFVTDATNRDSITNCLAEIVNQFQRIDAIINTIGLDSKHTAALCVPSTEVNKEAFLEYTDTVVWSQFLTASVAAPYMQKQKAGVIVFLTATPARGVAPFMAGHSAGHAAIEGLVRSLATEWGPSGIRVVGIRSGGMPETRKIQEVLSAMARLVGVPEAEFMQHAQQKPLLGRMPRLKETAGVAAFLASDLSSSLTGAIINSSCGEVVD